MELCDKIRIIRKSRQKSQEDLAHELGLSRQAISDWENGKFEPTLSNIRALSEILDISFNTLLDDTINLKNEQTLKATLNHVSDKTKSRINTSHRYYIYQYTIRPSDYIKLILYFFTLVSGIVLTIIGFVNHSTAWGEILDLTGFTVALSALCIICLPIMLVRKIIRGGTYDPYGTLSQTHFVIMEHNDPTYDKTIYVPVSEIISMEIAEGTNKKHGRVIVNIKDKAKPYLTTDIINPMELIYQFNRLSLNEEKETKEE